MPEGTSYQTMRMASQAKDSEEKRVLERKKALLVLICRHLCDHGYIEAAERLQTEGGVSLQNVDAADNIDLLNVLQEYEDFYEIRFQRRPKLTRKVGAGDQLPNISKTGSSAAKRQPSPKGTADAHTPSTDRENSTDTPKAGRPPIRGVAGAGRALSAGNDKKSQDGDLGLNITSTKAVAVGTRAEAEAKFRKCNANGGSFAADGEGDPGEFWDRRLLKPLPDFGGNSEMRELGAQIQRDVLSANPDVRWSDVASNDDAKRLLKEAVVMPIKYPMLFQGLLSPWKGVLLYGPPGTGKTMLAKAVATECKTTFFNISASSIVSKWRGDSEKLVRVLFELARYHKPSTIFLDEIDSIMSQRQSGGAEHDGGRRMKTEVLIQMDGVMSSSDLVFLLCASNLPWDLDSALLRRLEKRIFVPLPGKDARKCIVQKHLNPERAPGIDYDVVADRTEGFSGSDVVLLCKEAAMRPLRRIMKKLEAGDVSGEHVKLGPVTAEDVVSACQVVKPAQRVNDDKYSRWAEEFGSV
jgi:katanin p60 ATPase-containing subunit A1